MDCFRLLNDMGEVLPGAEASEIVQSFGEINPDTLPLSEVAAHRKEASELVDKVRFNDGP